jgi:hypothetical protein
LRSSSWSAKGPNTRLCDTAGIATDRRLVYGKRRALPTSPSLAQTLPSDAVLDALKMILLGAPLNEVLTTITRLIESHSTGMRCSISLLDEDGSRGQRI